MLRQGLGEQGELEPAGLLQLPALAVVFGPQQGLLDLLLLAQPLLLQEPLLMGPQLAAIRLKAEASLPNSLPRPHRHARVEIPLGDPLGARR